PPPPLSPVKTLREAPGEIAPATFLLPGPHRPLGHILCNACVWIEDVLLISRSSQPNFATRNPVGLQRQGLRRVLVVAAIGVLEHELGKGLARPVVAFFARMPV